LDRLRHASVVRFGTYEIDLHSGEFRKAGVRVRVQQQPLKLLQTLLEHPGEVVSREELRGRIWPNDTFGDFDQAVNVAIAKLRSALGDSADNPRYIETLPRRGYRFIGDVAVVNRPASKLEPSPETAPPLMDHDVPPEVGIRVAQPKRQSWQQAWKGVGLAVVAVAVILIIGTYLWKSRPPADVSSSDQVRSLAVLPLENLSSNPEDYFAEGMTDELITDLAQISDLRVISRTSVMPYRGVRKPLPQIARELHVDAVVEGTVLRSGRRVRITAQLIRVPADKHLWAQSYEGDVRDTLTLQRNVALAITRQIRIKLTPQEQAVLQKVKVVNPEAYEDYLKGRYFLNKRTTDGYEKATYYFNQAIVGDPTYPLPYTGLADIYLLSERPQLALREVQKALGLDAQLAEAHNSLARLLYLFNRDWAGADREFKRALELNHNYAPAHHWYSMYLAAQGRPEQALAEAEKAYELDPLSPVVGAYLAKVLQEAGQDDKAVAQAKKTLDLAPDSGVTHAVLGIAYQDKRMYAEAIAEYKKALQTGGPPAEVRGLLGYAYATSGNRNEAEKMITELKALWPGHTHAALDLAVVFSGLGDRETTLYWLDRAEQARVSDLIGLARDSRFVGLRTDPRFQGLVERVRTPK
jgi:TolB-like protein/DNA-binding winged helix-turn-helix (wHTH) protein/Tfp pilus assembly protein PilF